MKLGIILPEPKRLETGEHALIPISKGHEAGKDLATTEGKTPELLARNASKRLWTNEELMKHMLSPKRQKNSRTDFSPERKNCFKSKIKHKDKKIKHIEFLTCDFFKY